jgi:hypothetical protein
MPVKNLLRSSLLANLLLFGLALWLVREKPVAAARHSAAAPVQITAAPAPALTAASQPNQAAIPKPFRWSQLESTDYRTYLANLRNIGCPEQTIRDILTADVDSVYAQRREQVERASTDILALRQKLDRLRGEESAFLASLLGDNRPSGEPASQAPAWLAMRNIRPTEPLVFDNIDPAALQLNSGQLAVIAEVRAQFRQEIGVEDTNDPAYTDRWNQARRNADDRLRGILGSRVYLQYQLQAANRR